MRINRVSSTTIPMTVALYSISSFILPPDMIFSRMKNIFPPSSHGIGIRLKIARFRLTIARSIR